MAEYIEREALKAEFMKHYACEYPSALVMAIIDNVSTADVVEVRHGKWIDDIRDITTVAGIDRKSLVGYKCSVCGRSEIHKEPYCNCGAKMDLGDDEK